MLCDEGHITWHTTFEILHREVKYPETRSKERHLASVKMLLSLTAVLFSLSTLSTALPSSNLRARDDVIGPSAAFQIYKDQPDKSMNLGSSNSSGNSSTAMAFRPRNLAYRGVPFSFQVSQGPNNTNEQDLVVSFANLPCPPASRGAYSFEFNFVPDAQYSSSGKGQIDFFKINGALPNPPTYNTVQPITRSLIGTFELPTGSDASTPKLIFINQLVCEPTINLRFAITQSSSQAGAVAFFQRDGIGLRERSGE